MLRAVEDVLRRCILLHRAVAQDDDPVCDLRHDGEIVAHIDARNLPLAHHAFEGAKHLDLRRHVERRGRFVEDDELRVADERHGGGKALQLAAETWCG